MFEIVKGGAMIALCLVAGGVLKDVMSVRIPGAILGLIFLLLWLFVLGAVPVGLKRLSSSMLQHVSLFFIPPVVALLDFKMLIIDSGIAILLALIPSTMLALVVTGCVFVRLAPPPESPRAQDA